MRATIAWIAALVLAGCAEAPEPTTTPTPTLGTAAERLAPPEVLHEETQDAALALARAGTHHTTFEVPDGDRHITLYFAYAGQGDVGVRMEGPQSGTYDSGRRGVRSQPGSEGEPVRFAEWSGKDPSIMLHITWTGLVTWKARVEGWAASTLDLSTTAFRDGQRIPDKYACDGASPGVSPQLQWSAAPSNTKALALYMEDVDAGPRFSFPHWWVPDLPVTTTEIQEDEDPGAGSEGGAYYGPCPPPNWPHRYHIWILALDEAPSSEPPPNFDPLRPHVLAYGYVHGVYGCTDDCISAMGT